MKILTPQNTIRDSEHTKGYRFIDVHKQYGMIEFTVFEVGDVVDGTDGVVKLIPLARWSERERGPIEYKDLPIVYNDFTPYPTFAAE